MDKSTPRAINGSRLRIFEASDASSRDEITVDLQEYRRLISEHTEAEEFWAGRRPAQRNSTRRAA